MFCDVDGVYISVHCILYRLRKYKLVFLQEKSVTNTKMLFTSSVLTEMETQFKPLVLFEIFILVVHIRLLGY